MVKLLFVLTVFFFAVTSMFFVFLTKFNEESKRAALMSRVAGVSVGKITSTSVPKKGGQTRRFVPTMTIEPTEEPIASDATSPTPIPKKILEIKLGEMEIEKNQIDVMAVQEIEADVIPTVETRNCASVQKCVGWQDFQLQLNFTDSVKPGSSDNKFIFQNKEYEVKILNKKDEPLNSFMYKIVGDSIIINPEGGIWEGNAEFAVGIYSDGVKVSEVKFVVE